MPLLRTGLGRRAQEGSPGWIGGVVNVQHYPQVLAVRILKGMGTNKGTCLSGSQDRLECGRTVFALREPHVGPPTSVIFLSPARPVPRFLWGPIPAKCRAVNEALQS